MKVQESNIMYINPMNVNFEIGKEMDLWLKFMVFYYRTTKVLLNLKQMQLKFFPN